MKIRMNKWLRIFVFSLFTIIPLVVFSNPNSEVTAQTPKPSPSSTVMSVFERATIPQPAGIIQVQIPRAYFVKGILHAEIEIKNDTQKDAQNIMYSAQIVTDARSSIPELIGYQNSQFFNLKKGESINQKLDLKLGSGFENGTYNLLIQLKTTDNQVIGYQTQSFPLLSSGIFLRKSNCLIQVGTKTYDVSDGPIIDNDHPGTLTCNITNPSSETISARTKFEYDRWRISANSNSQKEVQMGDDLLNINPNETKNISFLIPIPQTPTAYEGLFSLVDVNGENLTPNTSLRWTISGPSATFIYLNADQDSYKSGSQAQISLLVTPSADLAWPDDPKRKQSHLNNAQLKLTMMGDDKQICAEKTISLPKTSQSTGWGDQKIDLTVNKDCPSFIIRAEVINDNNVVASMEKGYGIKTDQVKANSLEKDSSAQKINNWWIWLVVGALLALLIIGIIIWLRKRGRLTNPPPGTLTGVLLFISMLSVPAIFGIQTAMAAVRTPIDSPISSQNIVDPGGLWWGNVSNFSQAASTGRSSFTVNANCDVGTLFIYGYADHQFCSNFWPGIEPQVYIDGQAANVSNVQSADSQVITSNNCNMNCNNPSDYNTRCAGDSPRPERNGAPNCPPANQFNLDAPTNTGGIRTGTATVSIPASAQNGGQHRIEVKVGAGGRHYSSSGGFYIYSSLPGEYASLTLNYQCNKCPAGQTDPHTACDPNSKTCKQVTGCGANTCTPGQNNCENCDNPNETKPHAACVNNQCVQVAACGAPSCNSTADCCPAGMKYDRDLDRCVAPQCNVACPDDLFCQGAADGCKYCLKQPGQARGKCVKPACGQDCPNDQFCQGSTDGCKYCLKQPGAAMGKCVKPACGVECPNDTFCQGATDGCKYCVKGAGAAMGTCQACPVAGQTNPHGECDGDRCIQAQSCGNSSCTDDKQCFAEEMCKCDGFDAVALEYPSNKPFIFDAFAKIEGTDIQKAIVEGMQFKMSESDRSNPNAGTIIAQSPMYTPQIVSQDGSKVRYKATWNLTPPTIKANKTYRVFADIKCKPKNRRRTADAKDPYQYSSVAGVSTVNAQGNITAGEKDLQLKTLNLIKKGQTDSCRFLFFEYDSGLQ